MLRPANLSRPATQRPCVSRRLTNANLESLSAPSKSTLNLVLRVMLLSGTKPSSFAFAFTMLCPKLAGDGPDRPGPSMALARPIGQRWSVVAENQTQSFFPPSRLTFPHIEIVGNRPP